jgi:hypothetical protein
LSREEPVILPAGRYTGENRLLNPVKSRVFNHVPGILDFTPRVLFGIELCVSERYSWNMANRTAFTSWSDAMGFILGGKARVTLQSEKTGVRYTYRINVCEGKPLYFVSVLTGNDNENSYSYIGIVRFDAAGSPVFALTAKSKMGAEALPVKGFQYALNALKAAALPVNLSIWHEGKCGKCGRTLTVPASIASGFGPECIKKVAA